MSIPQTVLVFVGIPALIILVIVILVIGPTELRKPSRYRPGRPWPHKPAWYLPHQIVAAKQNHVGPHAALTGSLASEPKLPTHPRSAVPVGGASGEW